MAWVRHVATLYPDVRVDEAEVARYERGEVADALAAVAVAPETDEESFYVNVVLSQDQEGPARTRYGSAEMEAAPPLSDSSPLASPDPDNARAGVAEQDSESDLRPDGATAPAAGTRNQRAEGPRVGIVFAGRYSELHDDTDTGIDGYETVFSPPVQDGITGREAAAAQALTSRRSGSRPVCGAGADAPDHEPAAAAHDTETAPMDTGEPQQQLTELQKLNQGGTLVYQHGNQRESDYDIDFVIRCFPDMFPWGHGARPQGMSFVAWVRLILSRRVRVRSHF